MTLKHNLAELLKMPMFHITKQYLKEFIKELEQHESEMCPYCGMAVPYIKKDEILGNQQ